jgi:hypothetical protein
MCRQLAPLHIVSFSAKHYCFTTMETGQFAEKLTVYVAETYLRFSLDVN